LRKFGEAGVTLSQATKNMSPQTPQTLNKQKLFNCINIKASQLLVEFETNMYEKLTKTDQPNIRPAHLIIKEAINTWLHSP
jgi:hypothetical protein